MNTYLIVSKIRRITKNNINGREFSVEFLSNRCIEANTKKEAFEQYNKFISEQNIVVGKFAEDVQATILNIIEL